MPFRIWPRSLSCFALGLWKSIHRTPILPHRDLEAHARDEIGLSETIETNPLQAAWASALSFICGAILPVLVVFAAPNHMLLPALCGSTLTGLAGLGWLSAHLGGAPGGRAVLRMLIWGVIALGVSYLAGEKAEGIFN